MFDNNKWVARNFIQQNSATVKALSKPKNAEDVESLNKLLWSFLPADLFTFIVLRRNIGKEAQQTILINDKQATINFLLE